MGLRPGYKQTEVGVIPEDWEVTALGTISETSSGTTPPRAMTERYFYKGTIPWVKTLDLNNSNICETNECVTEAALDERSLRLYPTGSVLVAMYGGYNQIGRTGILRTPATVNQAITAIRTDAAVLSAEFLIRVLNYRVDYWRSVASSSRKDPNIASSDIRQFQIAYPLIAEQETIAEVLSDADALIESQEQLLTKKRQLKQGAMQELLTGKKRLPGFKGDWRTLRLGEVIEYCSSGATPYRGRSDFYKGTVKWISSGELNFNVIEDTIEHISDEAVQKTNLKIHPAGTFLMAITGLEAAGTRGACGIVGNPATTNQSCMAIYPKTDLKMEYLYHYYVYRGNELAFEYCQGTKQQSYTAKLVKLLPIDLPPSVDEQTAIAAVLNDMDAEIATLEAKLTKARQLKTGMMQELLTGRIRLVRSSASVVPFVVEQQAIINPTKSHNPQINEAVVLAALARRFGTEQYPLARVRRTKLMYLLHRHVEHQTTGFLKKAAGPYNPATRYGGPEKIALNNRYVRTHNNGKYEGFVAAENISQANAYFEKWYGSHVLEWIEQFRFKSTEELELLSTVDMATEDLRNESKAVSLSAVKHVLRSNSEWKAKLNRPVFSDSKIAAAIQLCHQLFASEGETA